jgi:hypothetical protein
VAREAPGSFLFAMAPLGLLACVVRDTAPAELAHDARFGYFAGGPEKFDARAACGHWSEAAGASDRYATRHTSFPDADPDRACFTPVTHADRTVTVGRIPPGCLFPKPVEREAMRTLADRLENEPAKVPEALFPCDLTEPERAAAERHDAAVLRGIDAISSKYPYSAILVPGFGISAQAEASMASWLPGEACHGVSSMDRVRLGAIVPRVRRALDAWRGGVAPIVLVTGGAVHSPMVEAFGMLYLLECDEGGEVPPVLVEPCATHTHTNLRNAGRWLFAMGARVGYLVTDDGFQSDYFQDWTTMSLFAGSIDARSLRDWGYLIGSWRQASIGVEAGFWFTPFRFWAEPEAGLGSFTCDKP